MAAATMTEPTAAQPEGDPTPKEGDILAGKYRVERVMGSGGMGVVVAAEHTTLRQKVAVKLLRTKAGNGVTMTEGRQRTLREYANQDGDLTMWTQEFVERPGRRSLARVTERVKAASRSSSRTATIAERFAGPWSSETSSSWRQVCFFSVL